MTVSDGRIDSFVTGDDLEIERTIQEIPLGLTVTTAWFMVKRKYSDTDSQAIITKTITSVDTSGVGWIEDAGADGEALIHFYLVPAETSLLTALSEYPYSIKVKFNNGKVNTPETGKIVAIPAIKQGST